MRDSNVDAALQKIDHHFRMWSRRNLSVLGKILIVKTYGISQLIHVMQSLAINDSNVKKINATLYKFIWNRHYLAAKAPERIKREIVNKSIKYGGFGMLDVALLDRSLKIKAFSRLSTSKYPFISSLRSKLELEDFLYPRCMIQCDKVINVGLNLVQEDRLKILNYRDLSTNRKVIGIIKSTRLANVISNLGKTSLPYFQIQRQGKMAIGDLSRAELQSISRHVTNRKLFDAAREVLDVRGDNFSPNDFYLLPYMESLKDVRTMTSKQIRENLRPDPECVFKVGVIMSPSESLNYFDKINKLTCMQSKLMYLKILHGDIYTNDRLRKFGLRDNPFCDKCGLTDGIEHRLTECTAYSILVDRVLLATRKLSKITGFRQTLDRLDQILCTHIDVDITTLTIHSHVIRHVIYQRDHIPTQALIDSILTRIIRCESNENIKEDLRDLLREDYV